MFGSLRIIHLLINGHYRVSRVISRIALDYRDRYITNPALIVLIIVQIRYLYQLFSSLPPLMLSTAFKTRIKARSFTLVWTSSLICILYITTTERNLHNFSALNVLLLFGVESMTLLLTFFMWIYQEHESPVDSLIPR